MILVNKLLRALAHLLVQTLSALSVAVLALWVSSPLFVLFICIADKLNKIPAFIQGRYLIAWLVISCPFFIGFLIYVEVRTFRKNSQLKKNKK